MQLNHLVQKAEKLFVDSIKVTVSGGTGGHGLPRFGGIGGRGGDVYIKASQKYSSLRHLKKMTPSLHFKAGNGLDARRTQLVGQAGADLILSVPLGVTVIDSDKQHIGDLNDHNDRALVALGGRGGDKYNDSLGFKGQTKVIQLDIKMISDAVFVGFPNAGKSSLLRAVSNATPRVASFPFTTLTPHIGMVRFGDYRQITMADLPGLVEGAHQNIGLGHKFLKHIVRARILVFLIDINNVDLGPGYPPRTPLETLHILNKEIELYDDTILKKPAILAISKMDTLEDSLDRFSRFTDELKATQADPSLIDEAIRPSKMLEFEEIIPISSQSGLNIKRFKDITRSVIDKYAEELKFQKDEFSSFKELQASEYNRIVR